MSRFDCPVCQGPRVPRMIDGLGFVLPSWEGHETCEAEFKRQTDEDQARQKEDYQREQYAARMVSGFKHSGVAPNGRTLDNLKPSTGHRAALAFLKSWKFPDPGIVLSGVPGVGKTHLLVGLAKVAAERDKVDFQFVNLNSWLDSIRGLEFRDFDRALRVIESVPVLIIDDLGTEKLTEWAEAKLERVISYRFEFKLPTFITTNLDPKGMEEYLSPRLWSRLRGLAEFVAVSGEDHRKPRKPGKAAAK
jgi:DNA replication protein DnaC